MEELSYFRLHGKVGPTTVHPDTRDFVVTAQRLPVSLGRAATQGNHIMIDDSDGTISREHIKIDWSTSEKCYVVTCLSKNCAIVDRRKLFAGNTTTLKQNSAVRIGTAKFYISFPKAEATAEVVKTPKPKTAKTTTPSTSAAAGTTKSPAATAQAGASKKRKAQDVEGLSAEKPAKAPKIPKVTSAVTPAAANPPSATASTSALKPRSDQKRAHTPYDSLVASALTSGSIPQEAEGGYLQKHINNWIIAHHPEIDVQLQSLKKGVLAALVRNYVKVEEPLPGLPSRWITKPPPS